MQLKNYNSKPLVYAHRGSAKLYPESTLEAYLKSIELGVDAIDIDIQVTKDDIILAHHDEYLGSALTDNKKLYIQNLTYEKIREYSKNIYCLADIINKTKIYPNIIYQIEVKTTPYFHPNRQDYQKVIDLLLNIIYQENVQDRVQIQSFDWRALLYTKKVDSKIICSFISEQDEELNNIADLNYTAGFDINNYDSIIELLADVKADIWCPYYKELSQNLVIKAHQNNIKVIPWTVNNQDDIKLVSDYGVDGIITDDPSLLIYKK